MCVVSRMPTHHPPPGTAARSLLAEQLMLRNADIFTCSTGVKCVILCPADIGYHVQYKQAHSKAAWLSNW